MDAVFTQRKFTIAVLFAVASIVGLFTEHITGGEFIALSSSILGLYGAANVMSKKVE